MIFDSVKRISAFVHMSEVINIEIDPPHRNLATRDSKELNFRIVPFFFLGGNLSDSLVGGRKKIITRIEQMPF